jgi:transposase-like protein
MSNLSNPIFHDEALAVKFLESILWADGCACPKCGSVAEHYTITGKKARPGLRDCRDCRKQFTVKVGTVFESSHVPVRKWLQAAFLMTSSKKGMSAHQIHRALDVTYKTAWFMTHRLREAMRPGSELALLGGNGKIVEADETYVGGKEKNKHAKDKLRAGRGPVGKEAVFSLVERGGRVRSTHVKSVTANTLGGVMREQLDKDTHLMTDEARQYIPLGKGYKAHETVQHSIGEYVRGGAHTNTIEGYFSIFKRGMTGVYQHCGEQHLKRYLCEFDFRYNNRESLGVDDMSRTVMALKGAKGKRLTYRA